MGVQKLTLPPGAGTPRYATVNVATLGIFLDPVYQRMQNSTDHAIQNHVF